MHSAITRLLQAGLLLLVLSFHPSHAIPLPNGLAPAAIVGDRVASLSSDSALSNAFERASGYASDDLLDTDAFTEDDFYSPDAFAAPFAPDELDADTFDADELDADTFDADELDADTFDADEIRAEAGRGGKGGGGGGRGRSASTGSSGGSTGKRFVTPTTPAPAIKKPSQHFRERAAERGVTSSEIRGASTSGVSAYDRDKRGHVLLGPSGSGRSVVAIPVAKDGTAKTVFKAPAGSALAKEYQKQTGTLAADEVDGDELDAKEMDYDELDADELDADELADEDLDVDELADEDLDADELDADEMDADELGDDDLDADDLVDEDVDAEGLDEDV
ncbi:hypothetical protein HDU96_009883 [Phlyctochytrium bullatum]|nr:hypothetical protein HDU96_009883 [Phlyctochytrium bullatum]